MMKRNVANLRPVASTPISLFRFMLHFKTTIIRSYLQLVLLNLKSIKTAIATSSRNFLICCDKFKENVSSVVLKIFSENVPSQLGEIDCTI